MHPEMDGEYKVVELQCAACGALEEHFKVRKDATDRSQKQYVFDLGPRTADLPPWAPNFDAITHDDADDHPDDHPSEGAAES